MPEEENEIAFDQSANLKEYRMPLIEQIFEATQSGALAQPFPVEQMKEWMVAASIVKDDGDQYAESFIEAILSNSESVLSRRRTYFESKKWTKIKISKAAFSV